MLNAPDLRPSAAPAAAAGVAYGATLVVAALATGLVLLASLPDVMPADVLVRMPFLLASTALFGDSATELVVVVTGDASVSYALPATEYREAAVPTESVSFDLVLRYPPAEGRSASRRPAGPADRAGESGASGAGASRAPRVRRDGPAGQQPAQLPGFVTVPATTRSGRSRSRRSRRR